MSAASASPKSAYFWCVPESNSFAADRDAQLSKEAFDFAVAQVKSVVEPDSIRNDIWRESM